MADVVGDEHRAHRDEHLAADHDRPARVDERLVADVREVAEHDRALRVARAAAADPRVARDVGVLADERAAAAELELSRKSASAPTQTTSSQSIVPSPPISTPSPRTMRGATTSVPLAEPDALADRRARAAIGVRASRRTRARGTRPGRRAATRGTRVDHACRLVEREHGRQRHAFERDPRERSGAAAALARHARRPAPRRPRP